MNDRDSEKLDRIATDVAVTAAVQVEMSKRLDEQTSSVKVLNDAHVNNEVAHAELKKDMASTKEDMGELKKNLPIWFRNGIAIISLFIGVLEIVLNYLI